MPVVNAKSPGTCPLCKRDFGPGTPVRMQIIGNRPVRLHEACADKRSGKGAEGSGETA
jgi:hypothetical protein